MAEGGRKTTDVNLAESLLAWIYDRRSNAFRASKKSNHIRSEVPAKLAAFVVGRGWFEKFMKRNGLDCKYFI